MSSDSFGELQADMRHAYVRGAPGAAVSGFVWIAAAVTAVVGDEQASVWVLLVGGMAIFPLSLVVCRLLGGPAKHTPGNPLGLLAMESTVLLMAGIFIAWATILAETSLFFPVMLLVIGTRYLLFQSLYGLKHYWVAGGALCVVGFVAAVLNTPGWASAAMGGGIEVLLAAALFAGFKVGDEAA